MDGVPGDLWEAAKLAGPFGTILMLFMWWLERADRVRLQRERDGLLERVLSSMAIASTTIQEITRMIGSVSGRRGRDGG